MADKRIEAQGSKVDVTLESIHGIICEKNAHDVTAAVSFAGSASNMQVSSFTMCGRTGNLVIESNPMEVAASSNHDVSDEVVRKHSSIPLFATFNDPMEGRRPLPSGAMSTNSISSSVRPHLKLKLSKTNPHIPKRSLAKVNRKNATIQPNPSIDGHSLVSIDGSRGTSLYWESEGGAMPDIVEFDITVSNSDRSIYHEGIAHLVFYGTKRELGTTTMDLRIKELEADPNAPSDVSNPPPLIFAEDAYIRVRVEMTSENHPAPSPENIVLSDNLDEQRIGNIMIKLKEHEDMAAARAKAHRMTLDKQEDLGKGTTRRIFCSGGLDFGETFRAIIDALTKCERKRHRRRRDGSTSFIPLLRASSTMESTIETRESMLI